MASDDDDEVLAQFLESEILSGISDEEEKREVLDEEDDYSIVKKMLVTEGNTRSEVEEEEMEAIRKEIEEDVSEEAEMRKEEEKNEEEEEKEVKKMLDEEDDICGAEEEVEGDEREMKRRKIEEVDISNYGKSKILSPSLILTSMEIEVESSPSKINKTAVNNDDCGSSSRGRGVPRRIENGIFSKVPPELFRHILKFLSSEDLIACSLVCSFLNYAASDESLWHRLYCMRWGLLPPDRKLRECAWKKLYIQRDEEDLVELVRNCPSEFKEYYIQMQAAKRSQVPLPSQINEHIHSELHRIINGLGLYASVSVNMSLACEAVLDDRAILDKTVSDQVSMWKTSRGLTDKVVLDHNCSGETCTYFRIGDVFLCEKTGNVHVCDDTCREVVADPANELLVCTISGRCFDRLLSPSEIEPDMELQQGGITDEAEPFMGSGRFARAYLLGYNCVDEKELEDTLRFC